MWPFTRKPKPTQRNQNEWRVGDLCEYVPQEDMGWQEPWACNPNAGDILRVSAMDWEGRLFLCFEGKPSCYWWEAEYFRKIVVQHQPAEKWFAESVKGLGKVSG